MGLSWKKEQIMKRRCYQQTQQKKYFGVFVHFIENDSTTFDWKKTFFLLLFSFPLIHKNLLVVALHLNASLSTRKKKCKKRVESSYPRAPRMKIKGTAHPQCRHIIDVKRRETKCKSKRIGVNNSLEGHRGAIM